MFVRFLINLLAVFAALMFTLWAEYSVSVAQTMVNVDKEIKLDQLTGCAAPRRPPELYGTKLPDTPVARTFQIKLAEYHDCRMKHIRRSIELGAQSTRSLCPQDLTNLPDEEYLRCRLQAWNGEIFWAPAATENPVNRAGDQARAVFGELPVFDCDVEDVYVFKTEVNGNSVDLVYDEEAREYYFEHRDLANNIVEVANNKLIEKCDKPSLAGGTHYCGLNSRIAHTKAPNSENVDWLVFCRKGTGRQFPIEAEEYWHKDNPDFSLLGIIGFNTKTGETTFFDGASSSGSAEQKNWLEPFVVPGGDGYADEVGRAKAAEFYDHTFAIDCHTCHDNKNPWILAPHIKHKGIGYRNRVREDRFSSGVLVDQQRSRFDPFRVVGSDYIASRENDGLGPYPYGSTIEDPSGKCTSCHTLTTLNTGRALAYDAVGKINSKYTHTAGFWGTLPLNRTVWSTRRGEGAIYPWMVPRSGNNISGFPVPMELSDSDWEELERCLNDIGENCDPQPLFTQCPSPEAPQNRHTRLADPAKVNDFNLKISEVSSSDHPRYLKKLEVSWRYLNDLGGVPDRDDVRFDIAITEQVIPPDNPKPLRKEYLSIADTTTGQVKDGVFYEGHIFRRHRHGTRTAIELNDTIIKNASFLGHTKYTDPKPSTKLRAYGISIPVQCDKRYLVRLVPKRFCFDNSKNGGRSTSPVDHIGHVDVKCR